MLTKSEKEWLEKRSIGYCQMWCTPNSLKCHIDRCCPTQLSFMDYLFEAMFESRVAAKLASWEQDLSIPCMETAVCERHPQNCPWCRLKYTRLAVEEEMDGTD